MGNCMSSPKEEEQKEEEPKEEEQKEQEPKEQEQKEEAPKQEEPKAEEAQTVQQVRLPEQDMTEVQTSPDGVQTWFPMEDCNAVRFKVKCNNECFVSLAPFQNDLVKGVLGDRPHDRQTAFYTMQLGVYDVEESYIMQYPEEQRLAQQGCEFSPADRELTDLWVSWGEEFVMVGKGTEVGEDEVMRCPNSLMDPIKFLSVSTRDTSEATWQMYT